MINALVRATVWYSCDIEGEDEEKVHKFIEENGLSLTEAVDTLYWEGEISIYDHSHESDFSTEEIEAAEEVED